MTRPAPTPGDLLRRGVALLVALSVVASGCAQQGPPPETGAESETSQTEENSDDGKHWELDLPWYLSLPVALIKMPFQIAWNILGFPFVRRVDDEPDEESDELDGGAVASLHGDEAPRFMPTATNPYYSRRVAVVIGIDRYEHWPDLEGARRDAALVTSTFRGMGFHDVIEIYDGEATRKRILSALDRELSAIADSDSMVVIFFAGHGQTETLPGGGKRGYIVPADGDPNQVFATSISMATLRDISSRTSARQVYYAMDSCYSGLGLTRGLRAVGAGADYARKVSSLRTVQMITAGSEGEVVHEEEGQGIFTHYFVKALVGEADFDGDGLVTASEIGTYVRPRVTTASRLRQTPQFGTLEGSGEVIFEVPTPQRPSP